jgi:hypothetical protein
VVTRGGCRVALIVPAPRANGAAVAEVLARWGGRREAGDAFAAAGEASVERDTDPWRD